MISEKLVLGAFLCIKLYYVSDISWTCQSFHDTFNTNKLYSVDYKVRHMTIEHCISACKIPWTLMT